MNTNIQEVLPSPLIIGGHSFIPELGNDPALDVDSQLDLVNTCIDAGISAFDRTYAAERIAVGKILAAGHVRALGIWAPGRTPETRFTKRNPFAFMVAPRNVAEPNDEAFQAGKQMGWRNFATSPFGRGWLLDKLLAIAAATTAGPSDLVSDRASSHPALRAKLADVMLRFSLHNPYVDHLIVGIRKKDWIWQNLASVRRGPLEQHERAWLLALFANR